MPELFAGVVLESPFVDVVTTLCDPNLPLTQHEYDEFGDPTTTEGMAGLREICPYQNIGKNGRKYPPVMITCSTTDERVPFWGPLKYAARLRGMSTAAESGGSGGDVVVLADAYQGHLPDGREAFDVKAMQYAFLIRALGEGE